jgi:hypothetical protein
MLGDRGKDLGPAHQPVALGATRHHASADSEGRSCVAPRFALRASLRETPPQDPIGEDQLHTKANGGWGQFKRPRRGHRGCPHRRRRRPGGSAPRSRRRVKRLRRICAARSREGPHPSATSWLIERKFAPWRSAIRHRSRSLRATGEGGCGRRPHEVVAAVKSSPARSALCEMPRPMFVMYSVRRAPPAGEGGRS